MPSPLRSSVVLWPLLTAGTVGILGITAFFFRPSPLQEENDVWAATLSAFEEWIPLSGRLEAAEPVTFRSELDGLSKLTFLAEDGSPVIAGDVLAKFDASDLEERERTLLRDRNIAKAALTALIEAEHPLELQRIQQELLTLEADIRQESLLLEETRSLVEEELLAGDELEVHKQNLITLKSRQDAMRQQVDLTRRILHPAAAETARARLAAAEAGLKRVQEDLQATEQKASISGVVHLPLIPIDGERRPARIGDGLYRNQVYLYLSNLNTLLLRGEVTERLLSKVVPGMEARIRFPAFPGRVLRARVTQVGAYPRGPQRHYPVELQFLDPPTDLRPGLTATMEVLSSRLEEALVLPRRFLIWSGRAVRVQTEGGLREVTLGPGNAEGVVITSGLEPGSLVEVP